MGCSGSELDLFGSSCTGEIRSGKRLPDMIECTRWAVEGGGHS
jgi:hypothetical protein